MYEDIGDFCRSGFAYFLLLTVPILFLCSNSVMANEFSVQRLSQFDINSVSFGCRASALNLEAKSINTWTNFRHCVVTRFQDLTIDQFREIRAKAGGLIVLLPSNLKSLSLEEKQHIYLLEQAMLAQEISIPVYFSKFDGDLEKIVDDVALHNYSKDSKNRESPVAEIFNKISANGYQITVSGATHVASKVSKIPIIQGELVPFKQSLKTSDQSQQQQISTNKLPLIIVASHLKTFGLTNDYPSNYESTIFLTLVDLFSKLYNQVQTTPKYRLLFLLTESGNLLNFQGAKKWLELNLEENVQLQNAEFVVCLDSLNLLAAETVADLHMHVSKPPKEGTNVNKFYQLLRKKAQLYGNKTLEGVHKKINLADTLLAWEHERFSMKRIPAFTISSLKSHSDPLRSSIFNEHANTATLQDHSELNEEVLEGLEQTTKIIAETLATYIYNIDGGKENENGEIFTGTMAIGSDTFKPYLHLRSMSKNQNIKQAFEKYLRNVKHFTEKPDPREPEFMFYDGDEAKLNVYNVKPAVFDLFLTFIIAIYLFGIYIVILHFPKFYTFICKFTQTTTVSANGGGANNASNKVKAN